MEDNYIMKKKYIKNYNERKARIRDIIKKQKEALKKDGRI